ncbi:MAG: DUF4230 domain-containing protein [Patescibacteria group bacterium]
MKIWKIYAFIFGFILVLAVGFFLGWRLTQPQFVAKREVNAQVILTALRDRGFLVTQTYVFDQPVTIKKTSGSAFKDFFFGQTITARGAMEVNLGIDLAKVSEQDVVIEDQKITVTVPTSSLFNVRLVGPIDVRNDQGILKRVLQNEDGYNEALAELSRIAEETANKPEFLDRATLRAKDDIARLLGYVAEGKTIEVITQ